MPSPAPPFRGGLDRFPPAQAPGGLTVPVGPLVLLVVVALALGGCGGGERARTEPQRPTKATSTAAPTPKSQAVKSTATPPPASKAATTATPANPGPATPAATAAPASGPYAAGVGWDVPPYTRDYGLAGSFAAVGLACATGLPPGAAVSIRLAGQTGAQRPVSGVVRADGSVEVAFGLQRPGELVWEFASITPREGVLPRGRAATWGSTDQPCEPR